ncbi:PTS fructose transporter subunit IIC [Roseibacillus persicicus]|uniref:protein-N(pi)-phosphohistidine--D-fructose phosphotransferase n=1 Tax=Roseibacillus persicicus TaxID=454148 RepID=A0A918TT06_9BACT|nr:fructose-specific PTS transporter subunit EIIC [Roseibacillus persicicus]GHC61209.1 PTS fructose transporter subunit IIBC [Roseibacillus persicicus]
MKTVSVVLSSPPDEPLSRMAIAALEAEASLRELALEVSTDSSLPRNSVQLSSGGDSVASDRPRLIGDPGKFLELFNQRQKTPPTLDSVPRGVEAEGAGSSPASKFLVGVTSCPTGIAHTFMAAEALAKGAAAMGYTMKVETRGSVGAKNELTDEEIARADAVIVAADANVETARFAGKRLLETGTKAAINDSKKLIEEALKQEPSSSEGKSSEKANGGKEQCSGPYKHLMTGVSHMLPLVTAGGLCIALAFAFGGIYAGDKEGSLGWALMQIGGASAFALFIPIFAGFIAFSIADRPGLTPGLIGGMLATSLGAGFLGGIVAGFMAGYFTRWLNKALKLPDSIAGLKPVLLLPLISSLVIGLAMIYVVGPPVKGIMEGVSSWLMTMQGTSALLLGLILGGMMAFDMGGPINKAAYTFAVGLVATKIYGPMAAVMAAGMVPPLGLSLAATLFKNRFTSDERKSSKATALLGISFITEGAIPFAAADPFRVIPSIVAGAAVAGAISLTAGCQLVVPHGGIFVLAIPNAINHMLAYVIAILAGTLVTTALLFFLKKPQEAL